MTKLFSKPKALLGITLVLCMILSMLPLGMLSVSAAAWDGTIAESYAGGDGTEETPYEIATGAQLAYLAEQVNGGTNYAGVYFKLTSDIDLGDVAWTPIANASAKAFRGILDGDGHAITNLSINATAAGTGLFGYTGYGAVIKNLSLEGNVNTTANNAAAFVGYVTAGNTLTISNCLFTGSVISTSTADPVSVGAFVGHNWNASIKIENCSAVNATVTSSGIATGGLVGIAMSGTEVTITNSSFSGTVTGGRGTGGLVGGLYYGNSSSDIGKVTIENSYSEGSITATSTSGGLVGYIRNDQSGRKAQLTIKDSYSTMTLPANNSAGLVGGNYGWKDYTSLITVSITDSFFAGSAKFPILNSTVDTNNKTDLNPMVVTLSNVYYLEGAATTATPTIGNLSPEVTVQKTASEFADGTVQGLLNHGRSVWKQGKTYPVLKEVEPPLSALKVDGVEIDVAQYPFSYGAGTVSTDSITVVPTPAQTGATYAITAVDETGSAAAVQNGVVTLAEGATTTITIAVTYKFVTTNYTVTVYRKPAPWNGSIAGAFAGGDGTEGNPWQIATGAQLAYLAEQVNAGTTYSGVYFKLTSDIDLGDVAWTPIGNTSSLVFRGIFDGDGYAITNLSVSGTTNGIGLFGCTGAGATIKNLTVEGNVSATAGSGTAGFVGYATAGTTLTISNCVFTGTVTSTSTSETASVGSFVGYNWNSTIKLDNCVAVNAIITGSTNAIGGLVGIAISGTDVTITNSSFSGSVTGTRGIGGLVGAIYYGGGSSNATDVTIKNSYSAGTVTGSAVSGGLVGLFNNQNNNNKPMKLTIIDCYSTATLLTDKTSGGLVGANHGWQDYPSQITVSINDSFFAGKAKYPILHSSVDTTNKTDLNPMNVTLTNVYYLEGSATTETATIGNLSPAVTIEKTATEFADGTVCGLLNHGRTVWKQGKTHPAFELEAAPLSALTVGDVEVDVTKNPYTYDAGSVSVNTFAVKATPAQSGAKVLISAVDETGKVAAVDNGIVTLAEGCTTTVTIAVINNTAITNYTVTVYRMPAAWNGTSSEAFAGGDGSEGNPWQIATGAQLAYLAEQVNAGTTYSGVYFKLTKDINLGENEWTPIGNSSTNAFKGTLDGDEHTIFGLSVNSDAQNVGLFGFAAAKIKNLTLEGNVKSSKTNVAGFVAYVPPAGTMTFTNCTFKGTVEGVHASGDNVNVGAFVSYNWNSKITIENCAAVDTTITSTTTSASSRYEGTGGLVGTVMSGTDVTINNSYFSGTVNASQRGDGVGGLVGAVWYSNGTSDTTTVTITNSYSEGFVKAQRMAGGLVGYVRVPTNNAGKKIKLTITDCYSTATVTATGNHSGLLGGNYGYNDCPGDVTVNITDSFFAGSAKYGVMKKTDTQGTEDATKIMTVTLTNVYYKAGSATTADDLTPAADFEKTADAFADGTVSELLGSGWATSTKGYPVHSTFVTPDNALVKIGTSIRTYGTTGMRFYFKMDTAAQVAGLKEYGVVLGKEVNLTNGLFVGAAKTAKAVAFDGETTVHVREDVEENNTKYDYFTALLNIQKETNFTAAYNARAYALYEDDKGQEIVVYSPVTNTVQNGEDVQDCTLYNIASMAYADYEADLVDFTGSELEYLEVILGKKNPN